MELFPACPRTFLGMSPENSTIDRSIERTIVGLSYIVVSMGMIIPYAICLYIIGNERKFRGVPFYRIALFMGVTDIGQLVCNGLYAGIYCLGNLKMPYWIEKFNNSFLCMFWYTYTMLTHILAINRFVTMFWPEKVDSVFTYKVTSVLIVLSFLHGCMWFGVFMWPDVFEFFSTDDYSFLFDNTKSMSMLAVQLNAYEDYVHSVCMVLWYTLVYVKLRMKKNQIFAQHMVQNNARENKVLLQSVVLCSMDIGTIVTYLVVEQLPHSRWVSLLSNYVWLFCAGNCPLIYLTLNSEIRARFLKMFCKNRVAAVDSQTISSNGPQAAILKSANRRTTESEK